MFMSNENPRSLSAKRITFLALAVVMAVLADTYLDIIGTKYSQEYVQNFLHGSHVAVYSLTPILYYANLFILYGSLAFIGYSAGSISQLLGSFSLYVVLGPVQSAIKYAKGVEESGIVAETAKLYFAFSITMLVIAVIPFLLRRFMKIKSKMAEAVLHTVVIAVSAALLYAIFRFVAPYIVYGSFLEKETIIKVSLMLKDMVLLAPITLGISTVFVMLSRQIFKKEFILHPTYIGGLNYNPPIYEDNTSSNMLSTSSKGNDDSGRAVCSHCGSTIAPDSKFCSNCGSSSQNLQM